MNIFKFMKTLSNDNSGVNVNINDDELVELRDTSSLHTCPFSAAMYH